MDFRVLGPLEAAYDSTQLTLGGPKQRALLALLLLHANHVVPRDRLIEELWGDAPPPSARAALNVYLSRLRKLLEENGGGDLVRRGNGYTLVVDPQRLDVLAFERLADEGRTALEAGDPAAAARILCDALALWRGAPLADLDGEPFVDRERRRLDDLRVAAIENRIDAELELGRHEKVVPELETLVAGHPFRERLWAQLLLALYRAGRQADALDAYRRARRILVSELGIEPGPVLRELESKILSQDPALAAPPAAAATRRSPVRALRRWPGIVFAAATVAALASALALREASNPGAPTPSVRLTPNSVGLIDPRTNEVVARFTTGSPPRSIATGDGAVWVAKELEHTIRRIDSDTGRAVEIGLAKAPRALAFAHGRLWVVAFETLTAVPAATLISINPASNSVGPTLELRGTWTPPARGPAMSTAPGIAVGADTVWVRSSNTVWRIDPATVRVVATIRLPDVVYALTAGDGNAWLVAGTRVFRVDGRSNAAAPVMDGGSRAQWDIAVGSGFVWITNYSEGSLRRIDGASGRTTRLVTVGNQPGDLVARDDAVWVATAEGVARLDPATSRIVATIPVGPRVQALAWDDEGLWLAAVRRS